MDAAAYARQLFSLLPPGRLWKRDSGSVLSGALLGSSDELARVDGRMVDLQNEWDPRTALETLPDWERVLQITPSPTASPAERRVAITAAYIAQGGSTPAYFTAVAASLGYYATVVEGIAPSVWRMDVDLSRSTATWGVVTLTFRSGTARSGDRLGGAIIPQLENVIRRLKPSHTSVSFNYI